MGKENIQVSVLVSCFNAERYLQLALDSILSQTLSAFELILIDDGSTDGTNRVIRDYAEKDGRVVWHRHDNIGLARSLNVGLDLAHGELVARIDADDLSAPSRLECQMARFRRNPGLVALGTACRIIDSEGRIGRQYSYPTGHKGLVKDMTRGMSPFPHSSAMFRLQAAKERGGYRDAVNGAEDLDLWLRMAEVGQLACLPQPLTMIRKHDESLTERNPSVMRHAVAARVAHEIRRLGQRDPLDADYARPMFEEWLRRRIAELGLVETASRLSRAKRAWRDRSRRLDLMLGTSLIRSAAAMRIGYPRVAKRLASEWMCGSHERRSEPSDRPGAGR